MSDNRILIDSHALIWLLYEPERISSKAKDFIKTADTVCYSPVNLWELTLKFSISKLAYSPNDLVSGINELNLDRLALRDEHILNILNIQLTHNDPFDTLLLAQSESEGYTFLTADNFILSSKYRTFKC